MSISLITRADDLGSSHAANLAIAGAAVTGEYIKNVSCMAVGPLIEEGAGLLKDNRHICFGMHATLNAEWDLIKWGPISPPDEVASLVSPEGAFFSDPSLFVAHPPNLDQVLREYDRQLDLLTALGLDIQYVDSHMFPELFVQGLSQAMSTWARQKGLIDHIHYYRFPSRMEPRLNSSFETSLAAATAWLDTLVDGGYFSVMHPAKYSREMLLCRNSRVPAGSVAVIRDVEYQLLLSRRLEKYCEEHSIERVRYDEAEPQGSSFQLLQQMFMGSKEKLDEQ